MILADLLNKAIESRAEVLYISAGSPPTLRLEGLIETMASEPIDEEDARRWAKEILAPEDQRQLESDGEIESIYVAASGERWKAILLRERERIFMAMKPLTSHAYSFEQLGLPVAAIQPLLDANRGLGVVSGPRCSGKTTTLTKILDWINVNRSVHIVTIETHAEYLHQPRKSIITQIELKRREASFAAKLKTSMSLDADVILVGELRDAETIEAALAAVEAETLVFGAMNVLGAANAIEWIIGQFPAERRIRMRDLLVSALGWIIVQRLLCKASGSGRVAAFEIMNNTPVIADLIRESKTELLTSAIQTSAKHGMITMDDYLMMLYRKSIISREVALDHAMNREEMRQNMMGSGGGDEDDPPPAAVMAVV